MGKSWMRYLEAWVQGQKHPDTPRAVFVNVYEWDRLRRILSARCIICGFVVSSDEKHVKELVFKCDNTQCNCHKMYGAISHRVCDMCYHMFHALYANYGLKNMNYFKVIDEKEKSERDDPKRRDRLGL